MAQRQLVDLEHRDPHDINDHVRVSDKTYLDVEIIYMDR